ncbi:MAG: aminopeptidase P family protein [Spirochaetaceae bacterium]|nr:aminopeptidase P family protein [Spirochaetaceae bacterium]
MNTIYAKRKEKVLQWMQEENIKAVVIEDSEAKRESALRYLCGLPSDGILIITDTGKTILCPWDENLAKLVAFADKIIPFTKYDRQSLKAIKDILRILKVKEQSRVEISEYTPYPQFLHYVDELQKYTIVCREKGFTQAIAQFRQQKDEFEIEIIKKAAQITDTIINNLEENLRSGKLITETDVALFIEKKARENDCEGTSFETLAAGPSRSYGIHAFPSYTNAPFLEQGLSILDFGVKYQGYCSDVTVTFAKGPLSQEQEKQLELVETAYNEALKLYEKDVPLSIPALKAQEIFAKAKRSMPHSLGHGIGLEIHEAPFVRVAATKDAVFKTGMVVTLEPGLYDLSIGGCRLENDILITEEGNEVLTHSRIIRL